MLSGGGFCDGLFTRPEESYRLWCVIECDNLVNKETLAHWGLLREKKNANIDLFRTAKFASREHFSDKFISSTILNTFILYLQCAGSSVGIATDYGLDGSGSKPGGDEIFRPSRPALGPTQPPVQWVLGLSWG